MPIMKAASI